MYKPFKTRDGRLKHKISSELENETPDINAILHYIRDYEKDNLNTINKLKKTKKVELNKINGALKQAINAHGPITNVLIGSASKRIYGALLNSDINESVDNRMSIKLAIGILVVGMVLGSIITMFL